MRKLVTICGAFLGVALIGMAVPMGPGNPGSPAPYAAEANDTRTDREANLGADDLAGGLVLSENNYWQGDRGMN